MPASLRRNLRVVLAVFRKDLAMAMARLPFTVVGVVIPINFLFLFILFALTGSAAPTAVVMQDRGPLAQQFVSAMAHAHSFSLRYVSAAEAQREIEGGRIVAVVTVPPSFDDDLRAGRQVAVPVEVNNLNVDFTNDIRRAVPLSITSFYAEAFPGQVSVRAHEVDVQTQDTGYVPYLAVSAVAAAFFLQALIQGANLSASEFEDQTSLELALSPAALWAQTLGKVAAAFVLTAVAGTLVTLLVVFGLGLHPVHPIEVVAFSPVIVVPFVAIGLLAGTLLKRRQAAIPLALGSALPLFFMSGPFGPPLYPAGSPPLAIAQALAYVSPLTYAIALLQHAFHGYQTWKLDVTGNLAVLLGFALLSVIATAAVLGRRTG